MSAFSPIFRINATVEKGQHYYSPASTTSVLSGINEEKYAKVVELTAGQHDNINDGNACKLKSDIEMAYYFYRKKKKSINVAASCPLLPLSLTPTNCTGMSMFAVISIVQLWCGENDRRKKR
jgi:hypothetical protein